MKQKRLLICLIALFLALSGTVPSSFAFGEDTSVPGTPLPEEPVPDQYAVISFDALPDSTMLQTLHVGDLEDGIMLPVVLSVTLRNGKTATLSPVSWQIDRPFIGTAAGAYVYTAVLPSPYVSEHGINLPTITVNVEKVETCLFGLQSSVTQIAGINIKDTIRIQPALGRAVYLQKFNPATSLWETQSTYSLSNIMSQSLTLFYPKQWYTLNQVTTLWRLYMPESETGTEYISPTVTINALRAYQNPMGYYQILPSVALRSDAGYNLRYGSMGLKVSIIQHKLGMGDIWEIIGPTTDAKIKAYQKSKGLAQTGVVDYSLWKRMGFSDYSWYYKAAYVSPMLTDLGSTKTELVEAFIANAYRYLGTEYIVGAAGAPKTGVDCSGLVMQSMYATGVDPYPISVIRHSQPGYEYESRSFWASSQLKTIPTKYRARGDLIFYQNKSGTVIHVAIYLGNGKVIEAVPSGVRVANLITIYPSIKGVKRVFN
jgi:hypothetical protein